jgi:leader peptidase (prepilin peptidase)/N-methyltransferase
LDPVFLALIIILGASFGSFFNVLIDRLPRKVSFIRPASHCTTCGKKIPFYLNIPILSYLILWGKCKYCKAHIPFHHVLVEIITPAIFVALFWHLGTTPLVFGKYIVLMGFLIPIFFIDLYHRLILDKMTLPLAILGIGFAALPQTDIGIVNSIATGAGILILLLGLAWLYEKVRKVDGLGGGDIKLLAAMATFVGAINIAFIVLFSSIIAVVFALASPKGKTDGVPYGPFLAVTTFIWLMFGSYFLQWYFGLILS